MHLRRDQRGIVLRRGRAGQPEGLLHATGPHFHQADGTFGSPACGSRTARQTVGNSSGRDDQEDEQRPKAAPPPLSGRWSELGKKRATAWGG
jgi:hypothetical protein